MNSHRCFPTVRVAAVAVDAGEFDARAATLQAGIARVCVATLRNNENR